MRSWGWALNQLIYNIYLYTHITYPYATTATEFQQEQPLFIVTPSPRINQGEGCSRVVLAHLLCHYRLAGCSPAGPAQGSSVASEHQLWLEIHSQVTQTNASKSRKKAETRKVRILRVHPNEFPFCFLSLHPADKRALLLLTNPSALWLPE